MTQSHAQIVDLLDRILDRGVVIDADIVISLAGVPLVGLKLRLDLAGMETMIAHGLLADFDRRLRSSYLLRLEGNDSAVSHRN